MAKKEILEEQPRKKRKYTKRAKMLLRSNNDYIDHTYWPKMYAKARETDKRIMKKYGITLPANDIPLTGEIKTRKFTEKEQKDLEDMGIGKRHILKHVPDEPLRRIPVADEEPKN